MGCGSALESFIQPVSDIIATVTGNPELIPLINAGEGTVENLAHGKGIGKSLESGAISGGEALAGQEVAGAFGIGNGNTAVNDALDINISPSATGLPDVGQGISSLFSGGNASGVSAGNPSGGGTSSVAPGSQLTTPTPTVGAGTGGSLSSAAGTSAPASVPLSSPDATLSGGGGTNLGTGAGSSASGGGSSNSGGFLSNLFGGSNGSASSYVNSSPAAQVASDVSSAPSTPIQSIQSALPVGGGGGTSGTSGGGIGGFLSRNASSLIPAAGLGYEALTQTAPKGTNQLTTEANQLNAQGNQLQSYLNNGTLPPGAQNSLTQAAAAAKAAIKSQYAARGMSGSSAEAQDLAGVDQRTASEGNNLALQLLQQGVSETTLSGQLYQQLMNNQLEQDKDLSSAITSFASSVAGGSGQKAA